MTVSASPWLSLKLSASALTFAEVNGKAGPTTN